MQGNANPLESWVNQSPLIKFTQLNLKNCRLKVLNYEGYSTTPIYPTALQHYDIVITTYNVLQAEMRLTETGQVHLQFNQTVTDIIKFKLQSLHLRHQRKYWPGGSALVRVMWWRLCLDEAQTVETPGCIVSLMAGKISAKHRWAVTGTPMAKGLSGKCTK